MALKSEKKDIYDYYTKNDAAKLNDSNKLFLLRYIKARDEEYYKKEKLYNSVNKKFESTFSKACKKERVPSIIPMLERLTKTSVSSG